MGETDGSTGLLVGALDGSAGLLMGALDGSTGLLLQPSVGKSTLQPRYRALGLYEALGKPEIKSYIVSVDAASLLFDSFSQV